MVGFRYKSEGNLLFLKNALNNKIDNAFKSNLCESCSKIFLWQNRIYLPGSGTWLASAITEKGELFAKMEASGLGHSGDSHLDVPSYRKFFPPPRTKPNWRETILKVFYHLIALMIHCQLNTILSQNPIFRGQTSWRSAKPAPRLVSPSLVQRSSREATRSPFWSQSTLAALPHNFCSLRSHTFAMKIPASMMALICLNQPEFSSPQRKSLMEGDLSSHTAR